MAAARRKSEDDRNNQLSKLRDLGFRDTILCKRMLVLHDGDIKGCIRELMQIETQPKQPLQSLSPGHVSPQPLQSLSPGHVSPGSLQINTKNLSTSVPSGNLPAVQVLGNQSALLASTAPITTELQAETSQLMLRQQQLLAKLGSGSLPPPGLLSPVQTTKLPVIDTAAPNPHDFQHECRPVPTMPDPEASERAQNVRERKKRQQRDRVSTHTVAILDALCNVDSLSFKIPETVILNPADATEPVRWYRMKALDGQANVGKLSRVPINCSTPPPKPKNHWVSEMSTEPDETAKLIAGRLTRDRGGNAVLAEFVKSSSSERKIPHTEYLNKAGVNKFIHRRWKGSGGVLRQHIPSDKQIGLVHVAWKSDNDFEVVICHDTMHTPAIDTPKVVPEKLRKKINAMCKEVRLCNLQSSGCDAAW